MNYEEKEEYWKKRIQYYEDKFNKFRQAVQAVINDDIKEEEPKEYWYIDWTPKVGVYHTRDVGTDIDKRQKQIGNYFETKEEAEKAVEKLKAWKRLKDKGFRFDGYDVAHNSNGDLCGQLFYNAGDYCIEDVEKDLDLLFGGEE